jgi:uncharacterized protein (DUF1810 family)
VNTATPELERFVQAQKDSYAQALAELIAGRKRTHWVWYVLPQLRELGMSQMARDFGITSLEEAAEYLAHPVLGPRLVESVNAVLLHKNKSAVEILGGIDAMKFRSCLTLFSRVATEEPCFAQALNAFYKGKPDPETLRLLGLPQDEA